MQLCVKTHIFSVAHSSFSLPAQSLVTVNIIIGHFIFPNPVS